MIQRNNAITLFLRALISVLSVFPFLFSLLLSFISDLNLVLLVCNYL